MRTIKRFIAFQLLKKEIKIVKQLADEYGDVSAKDAIALIFGNQN